MKILRLKLPRLRYAVPLVLMYHSVAEYDADPFRITVTPGRFRRQMAWLDARGLRGVSLARLDEARRTGDEAGLVGLTFDDGYDDFRHTVVPVLTTFGFTATVFAVAGELGGTNHWDSGGPVKRLMDADGLRTVAAAGMEVGSHSLHHHSMPTLAFEELEQAVTESRRRLTEVVGEPVVHFAYPYGHAGPREADAVERAGFRAAVLASPRGWGGFATPRTYMGETDAALRLGLKVLRHHRMHPGRTV